MNHPELAIHAEPMATLPMDSETLNSPMLSEPVVFLVDVDNTLLDNDRFGTDLDARLEQSLGVEQRVRYRTIYARLRDELGYADYLGTLQHLRVGLGDDHELLRMSSFFLDYPFDELLYAQSLDVLAHLRTLGPTVILSDGDVVFQPRKIQRAGLWQALDGRVLIGVHKELMLSAVQRLYPALHYVMIDDKPQLLARMKLAWGEALTTVFVRQGHYAAEAEAASINTGPINPPPDRVIEHIGELLTADAAFFASSPRTVSQE